VSGRQRVAAAPAGVSGRLLLLLRLLLCLLCLLLRLLAV
jgi:hypothetical protein